MRAVVENNIIYVVGGFNSGGGRLTSTLSYSPSTNAWSTLAPLKVGKSDSATGLLGAAIVSAGGLGSSAVIMDTEGYNAAANTWTTLAPIPTASGGLLRSHRERTILSWRRFQRDYVQRPERDRSLQFEQQRLDERPRAHARRRDSPWVSRGGRQSFLFWRQQRE
jgi:hypothetical protein